MMNKILKAYPSAYAVYDLGNYYGVANGDELFYIVDKTTLKPTKALMRYDHEVIELIEKAIPLWFADDGE